MNESAPRSRSLLPWLLGLLLVAAVIFSYQPAWNAGFIWDDDDYVTHNPLLPAPDGLWRIWFSTDSPSQYFPLVYTTFRFEYALWELNPTGYHWVNILLHAINALLVWRLLKRLALPGAWLAAAIFALHPVQVESVAWVTELKNVQSLFFFLLAVLAWVEFTDGRKPAWRWYGLALVFHALALFSKTTACTLPAALILTLWLKHQPVTRVRWVQVVPFVLLSLGMGLLTIWWERHHQGTGAENFAYGAIDRVLIASHALWFYLGKLVWPVDFIFSYPLWTINAADLFAYGWVLAAGLFAGVLYFSRHRTGRSPITAFVFFVAMLSPLIGFIMLYTFKYTFVADHYQYMAILGPAALAAAALHSGCARFHLPRFVFPSIATALLLCLASLTWQQAHMYLDLETLWRTTIVRNPGSFMGHNNLGAIFLRQGKTDEALAHFQTALEILPNHGNAHGNMAHALMQKGRTTEAITHFRRALEIEPQAVKAHSDLAHGLIAAGQFEEAMVHAQHALLMKPAFPEALYHLGRCFLSTGRTDDAIAHFQSALNGSPDFAEAHYQLALALFQKAQLQDSLIHFQLAAVLQPQNCEFKNNLGWALLKDRQLDAASECFQAVLTLQPNFTLARYNLALTAQQLGATNQWAPAISAAEHALKFAEVNNDLPLAAALRLHLRSYQAGEPSSAPLPTPTPSP